MTEARDRGGRGSGAAELLVSEFADLPLFPLPGVAFFPRTFMPLHVFEPRYRAMVRSVLEGTGAMGVVQLRRPANGAATERPEIHRVTGVGRIVDYEELPDGRFLILLEGLARARVVRELSTDEPFRRFELEEVAEERLVGASAEQALVTLRGCVRAIVEGEQRSLVEAADLATDPGALADLLASSLVEDPGQRQRLLETASAAQRVEAMVSLLAARLLERRSRTEQALN